ncbi:hypothetical protein [Paenibacillus flagellatus]|uniref:Uncharacterized protein n=1 Tax=Paenibacillus flagellatus TaxID=2211139 RepID=A0A2V5JZA9_9BACL|nr:hypothetical protein [Paenibacillus flagellatus]PYI52071.1 hypothetical protein DLM86_21540 [Paenibacillus flagellatus]
MDDTVRLKQTMLNVTQQLIAGCRFCVQISQDPDDKTPVHCVKYSGCAIPVLVNAATCLSCQEYKRSGKRPERPDAAAGS